MEAQKTLGDNIVFTRKTFNLNQQELAELAHVSSKTLRKIERGEFDDIFGDTVKKVCYALYEYSKTGSSTAKYWGTPSWLKEYVTSSIPDGYYCATLETVSDTSNAEVLKDILKKLDDISRQLAEVLSAIKSGREDNAKQAKQRVPDLIAGEVHESNPQPHYMFKANISLFTGENIESEFTDSLARIYLWLRENLKGRHLGREAARRMSELATDFQLFEDDARSELSWCVANKHGDIVVNLYVKKLKV